MQKWLGTESDITAPSVRVVPELYVIISMLLNLLFLPECSSPPDTVSVNSERRQTDRNPPPDANLRWSAKTAANCDIETTQTTGEISRAVVMLPSSLLL